MLKALLSDNAERFEEDLIASLTEFLSTNRKIVLGMAEAEPAQPVARPKVAPIQPPQPVSALIEAGTYGRDNLEATR